ncbi:MAG: hypothetical protein JO117_01925 [Verrucomicrobia bacterium]|nr:hypothetical protein [Verrucomicrobiota bacterium]MBV9656950.1 hypothetical protein [Verrucomicrobiota bacterium]
MAISPFRLGMGIVDPFGEISLAAGAASSSEDFFGGFQPNNRVMKFGGASWWPIPLFEFSDFG